jgi:hypothetical protein
MPSRVHVYGGIGRFRIFEREIDFPKNLGWVGLPLIRIMRG